MSRIVIDVSKGELDYMREALQLKHTNLMTYLDVCEVEAQKPPAPNYFKDILKQINESPEMPKEAPPAPKKPHWTQTAKGKKIMAARKRRNSKK